MSDCLFKQISADRISSGVRMDTVFHYVGSVTPAQTVMMAQMNHLTAVSDTALQVDMSFVIRYVKYMSAHLYHMLTPELGVRSSCKLF